MQKYSRVRCTHQTVLVPVFLARDLLPISFNGKESCHHAISESNVGLQDLVPFCGFLRYIKNCAVNIQSDNALYSIENKRIHDAFGIMV